MMTRIFTGKDASGKPGMALQMVMGRTGERWRGRGEGECDQARPGWRRVLPGDSGEFLLAMVPAGYVVTSPHFPPE
ncbi:hypothetical protein OPIT5_29995 [Opitutaceae bacterium TAV5]|nr:hypothetical protein OPIT5_29995 [Opitutaceae bacterium TAV5]